MDWYGTFFNGTPTYLGGLNFTLSLTTDPALLPQTSSAVPYYFQRAYGNVSVPFTETITLNGMTKSYSDMTAAYFGESFLQDGFEVLGPGNTDEVTQYSNTNGAASTNLFGVEDVYGPNPYNVGLNYDQVWTYVPLATDSDSTIFKLSGTDLNLYVYAGMGALANYGGTITSVTINEGQPVPEPGSLALTGAALLFLALARKSALSVLRTSAQQRQQSPARHRRHWCASSPH